MAQYRVYRNKRRPHNPNIPYLLDLQSELFAELRTRLVAPLFLASYFGPATRRLHPVFSIKGVDVVMSTGEIGAIAAARLTQEIADLSAFRAEIVAALDFVF